MLRRDRHRRGGKQDDRGRGRVIALSDPALLENRRLGTADDAALGLNLAGEAARPVVFDEESPAGRAYLDAVARFLGEQRELRFLKPGRRSFIRALFGRA